MKALNVILILVLIALTSACAAISQQDESTERFNSAYIQAVEDAAKSQAGGLDVIWVNPPTAKDTSEDSGSN